MSSGASRIAVAQRQHRSIQAYVLGKRSRSLPGVASLKNQQPVAYAQDWFASRVLKWVRNQRPYLQDINIRKFRRITLWAEKFKKTLKIWKPIISREHQRYDDLVRYPVNDHAKVHGASPTFFGKIFINVGQVNTLFEKLTFNSRVRYQVHEFAWPYI